MPISRFLFVRLRRWQNIRADPNNILIKGIALYSNAHLEHIELEQDKINRQYYCFVDRLTDARIRDIRHRYRRVLTYG